MPHIIPITDLRDTNKITELCATNEPVFVTKNAYGSLVLMSMQAYEESLDAPYIGEGLRQVQEGKTTDGEKFLKERLAKYE